MKLLSKKIKLFIRYIQVILILIAIPILYNFVPINSKIKTFFLASSKENDILQILKNHGYTVFESDKILLKLTKTPQIGWYTIENKYKGRFSFFKNLHKNKTNALMKIVIYAGETKDELTSRLSNDMKLNKEELLKQYNALSRFQEGDILANTYTIARHAEENATMQYLFNLSYSKIKQFEENNISIGHKKRTLKELIIIASIIQKESNSITEMPLISTVIHNRLNKNMYLQMDGTLNYGKYAHTIVSKSRIKNDTSAYNTYRHKGLPPHPLSSITLDALEATVHPLKKAYLFFMLNPTGSHTFSETYKEHLEKISIFRQYQAKRRKMKQEQLNKSDINSSISENNDDWIKKFEKF